MARVIIVAMLLSAAVLGGVLYYQQVYAYYDEVQANADAVMLTSVSTGTAEPVVVQNFQGIDAISSPLRYRACFDVSLSLATLTETFLILDNAEPRVAPGWFDCFDAVQIGADLRTEAVAFMGVENIEYGIDRVVAVYPDGRGYAWHQINACGEVVFDGNRPPEDCPPLPESTQ
ncbi:DUF6446 family protein [Roseobacter sp. CCS2]|uniref:DUF6446 family protein n=1 Tax=Roseobacter sp. CCS2 TaxID=391593 RepID=UPI0000F3E2BF|nr:DUF6446 family protein [Roseobacter sp. CCS2]EBA12838.1 hypothetical protein RCCS2_16114 [Roseobacter sp. CCS2]